MVIMTHSLYTAFIFKFYLEFKKKNVLEHIVRKGRFLFFLIFCSDLFLYKI